MSTVDLQTTIGKFIFRVRQGRLYTDAGTWLDHDAATGVVRIGVTDFMQQSSGDIAFAELTAVGTRVEAGGDLAAIETVKVDVGIPSPCAGVVAAVNPALADSPELINQDCYGAGWLVDFKPDDWPVEGLLDAEAYLSVMTRQAEEAAA
jgi:glycine cleavage system H protein